MSCNPCHNFTCSSEYKKKSLPTFDEQHGPAAQVFNGEDNVPGISQSCLFNTHPILAAVVDELDVVVGDHQLAIDGPGRLVIDVMRKLTIKSAALTLKDRDGLQALNNSEVQV